MPCSVVRLTLSCCACSCLSSSQASLPPGALTARHLSTFVSSLSSNPCSSSAGSAFIPSSPASSSPSIQSTDLYLLATLQCVLASASYHRHSLISALAVPRLMHLLESEQEMHYNALRVCSGVGAELQHLLIGAESGGESCGPVMEAALAVLSQLVISGTAVDSEVVHQVCCHQRLCTRFAACSTHSLSSQRSSCIASFAQFLCQQTCMV